MLGTKYPENQSDWQSTKKRLAQNEKRNFPLILLLNQAVPSGCTEGSRQTQEKNHTVAIKRWFKKKII